MPTTILKQFDEVEPFLDRVCAIADGNRTAFGFLPETAYAELAARDQLWVAIDDERTVLGYLLFGGGRSHLRIFQLYIQPSSRRHGLGSLFIEDLKTLAIGRGSQIIGARVAADLPANQFWNEHGFRVLRQVAGGQTTNRIINERVYEVAGSSLWAVSGSRAEEAFPLPLRQPILASANYAFDLNVLFDITKDREHAALVQAVIANALNNEYRLSVTSEFVNELERTSVGDDPILRLARSLPTLPDVPSTTIAALITELRQIVFPEAARSVRRMQNDQSDLRHLAMCIHHKVSGFITREAALLRRSHVLLDRYGVEVVSPAELSNGDVGRSDQAISVRAEVGGRAFAIRPFMETDRHTAETFLDQQGVRVARARIILDGGTTSMPRSRLALLFDSRLVAIATWGPVTRQTRELSLYLIVDEQLPPWQKAVDHVLETVTHSVPEACPIKLNLMTPKAQVGTRETAKARGFVLDRPTDTEDRLVTTTRYLYRRLVTEDNWHQFAGDLESVTGRKISRRCPTYDELTNTGLLFERSGTNEKTFVRLFQLETAFAPVLVITKNRPAIITPIQEHYANDLISSAARQTTLFAKEAPAYLERAYFGKPGLERFFVRGALVIFYISGRRNEAVGLARATASGRYSVDEAQAAFARQGVLSLDELKRVSTNEQLGVFTFDGYRNFQKPIAFADLRAKNIANSANLVTSQAINFGQLLEVLKLAQGA